MLLMAGVLLMAEGRRTRVNRTPEPGGLTPRELFPLIRTLCARTKVVGVEVVEMNPVLDPSYRTAQVVNRIKREAVTGIAMHKNGLTQPDYLSPLTVAHT